MLKKTDNLYELFNIKNQKEGFDKNIEFVINNIKQETNLVLEKKDIFVKKNIFKIKTSSNIKFLILLYLNKINNNLKQSGFIVEL